MPIRIPPACELITLSGTCNLESGGSLTRPVIAVERHGQTHATDAPVVLVFTGISPDAHICSHPKDSSSGWWEYMVGNHCPIDTDRFHVICVNTLGSCFGSTGPCSDNPETNQPYRATFPDITLWDVARLTGLALAQLEINQVHCVVGPSMGGMTALAWLLMNPGCTRHMINISAAVEADPFAIALRSLQREIVESDPGFDKGNYRDAKAVRHGMTLARKLGLTTYRSAYEWRQRFGRSRDSVDDDQGQFVIQSYLQINAEKFADQFDPNCYLKLSQAMDWFSVREKFSEPEQSLRQSGLESALVIGVDSDFLFPEYQQKEMAACLTDSGIQTEYTGINSHYGHDAFLIDEENFAPLIKQWLEQTL